MGEIERVDVVGRGVVGVVDEFQIEVRELFAGEVLQLVAGVARHDDELVYPGHAQRVGGVLQQRFPADRDHAFCLSLCIFSKPLSHARGQHQCLHKPHSCFLHIYSIVSAAGGNCQEETKDRER